MQHPNYLTLQETRSTVAIQTTRQHHQGVSKSPFDPFNLALHVTDQPADVLANRATLLSDLAPRGISSLVWLNQVHGTRVIDADTLELSNQPLDADAWVCSTVGVGCMIMTADCLPVVFVDHANGIVGNAHAGWKGLLAGVCEATLDAMQQKAMSQGKIWHIDQVEVIFGAAIGSQAFEVGPEVKAAFETSNKVHQQAFAQGQGDRWLADIYVLAKQRLKHVGITQFTGGDLCTVSQVDLFYSYRRQPVTGRMATIVAITA